MKHNDQELYEPDVYASKDSLDALGMETTAFIEKVTTYETGGGCPVDFVLLKSGRVLGISVDCVVLYDNMEDFHDMGIKSRQIIELYPMEEGESK